LRRELPEVFSFGEYIPLEVTGSAADHILAFARRWENDIAITVVPRRVQRLRNQSSARLSKAGSPSLEWGNTAVSLPEDFPKSWVNRLSGDTLSASNESINSSSPVALPVTELFSTFPVALLTAQSD
jgi:(1->4)-alpha-D-glucan 1-alpha-D-glucosylmutase